MSVGDADAIAALKGEPAEAAPEEEAEGETGSEGLAALADGEPEPGTT